MTAFYIGVFMKGLVHVYTGDGKGKTSCSLGLTLRALGWGKKVCIVQFVKGYKEIGELNFAKTCDNLTFIQISDTNKLDIHENDVISRKKDAKKSLEIAQNEIFSSKYDIVILDEINCAINYNLIEIEKVIELIKTKPLNVELVLTGRDAKEEIINLADYVTELKMIKHPYQKGIVAREGIDY